MLALLIMSAAAGTVASRPAEPDCKPQAILTANGPIVRDQPVKGQRNRARPPQPVNSSRPCLILASA